MESKKVLNVVTQIKPN